MQVLLATPDPLLLPLLVLPVRVQKHRDPLDSPALLPVRDRTRGMRHLPLMVLINTMTTTTRVRLPDGLQQFQ